MSDLLRAGVPVAPAAAPETRRSCLRRGAAPTHWEDARQTDVLPVVQTDVGQESDEDGVLRPSIGGRRHGDGLPFQIVNRVDPLTAEQLVASDVDAGQEDDWSRTHGQKQNKSLDVTCKLYR